MHHIGLHTKTVTAISNALNHCINDYLEQSWEESIFPALDMLEHVGPLHNDKDKTLNDYFSSVSAGQNVEFDFGKLVTYIENCLTRVVQMSIKLGGGENEKIDDFPGGENDEDTIHEEPGETEKSEWLNEALPAGAVVLLGGKVEEPVESPVKEKVVEEKEKVVEHDEIERDSREPSPLPQIYEDHEPGIEDEFI